MKNKRKVKEVVVDEKDPESQSERLEGQSNLQLVLKGIITEKTLRNLQPHKKLIIFVSSTFMG